MTNKEGVADAGDDVQTARLHVESDGNASFLRAARAGNLEKVLEYLKGSIDINTSNANGLNALHLASKEGHVPVVSELVKRGANVNAATKKGNTALHIASLAGQEEVVKILVRNGANVNVQSQNGFTPLYMAAQENHDAVVKFLLANGANQSLATEDGFTPLAVALQQGHDKVVAVLLENDAKGRVRLPALHIAAKKDDCKAAALLLQNDHDPDVTSKSGFTPLHIAAHYGNENIGKLLLEKNADVNYSAKHQITPLHVAAKWGKSNMVNLLVDKGAKIDASTRDGLTPLHCAARSGHEQVVDLLLEKGAPITAKTKNGLAPLHMASQGDHVDGSRILLYHKAPVDDVTVDYLTALHVAAHCGHVRVAKLLLDRKADPNARALNGFTPLHIACKKNRIKVVELLLKHGASIEATTESGLTPLHVASFMGCMNIVIYLIQHGANPDVPTVRGETPLHLAARANQSDIIRILLRNGAHVDASAREHQTPLHIAARLGNVDIVGLLLQHGAAVDATTKDMYTALHIAAKEGQEEVASVLLDHGASLTATTKKGFTPLHLAAKYGNIKVARLLLQKDAPVDAQGKNGVTPLHVAAHYDHVNVALLLLDKGAYPHATAKNGYTPLHIAAKKNQMDIATTLLEYGAKPNAESKAGFNPLHLAAQEGHTDMTTLLIEHHADVNTAAKNGLTPLHLCAQEDRVNVAAILVKTGAEISLQTKAGYSPLHVACHFGQINMIRFLLQHGADVNATTSHGYTPLHQAAQQGHTLIINLLLEHKASPNSTTNQGQTALSIAQRLGYISVVETLKIVTETVVTTTTTTITEEKYKVVAPETMQETFMSDSEDEGGDDIEDTSLYGKPAHATHVYLPYIEGQRYMMTEDTMLGDQSFRYLTADEMKSLGDDSLPIDVTRDERGADSILIAPLTAEEEHLTPQHIAHQEMTFTSTLVADNVDISRAPVHAGFLVSFMVDARGGAMRGCRHSGVRVIIPPRKAPMPMRITCRYLRKEKLAHPPPLMEGEACASRILEVGPAGAKFLGPVIIEVPHFAALRGREREITILRSDNGETWREHLLEASDDAVHDVFNESFEGEDVTALEDLNTNRITRILTTDFPQYFAIITRIRQEVHAIGPEGGVVSSTVVPQVQAIFPEGALTKKIKVGLQAHPITPELVTKLLGNRVAVSPIVTVEPRRRKFHKPITLTIPVPQAATKGMINQYSGDAPTLRLLCSITGGTTKAQWEDVTGSTPLTFVNDCVSFTTTVSARFWLMDCRQVNEATKFATELYREAIHVPFMAKFVVFAKRHDPMEAQLRVFCMTDDKEDKTLECQEHFTEVAKSRDVEVLEAKSQFLEFVGNLIPVTKSGEQLKLTFQAFRENRLPFTIRVKDQNQEPLGRVAFMREPRVGRGEPPQSPICNLNISLPEAQITPISELVTLEKKYGFVEETGLAKPELIHRADLRLSDIASELREDWIPLALQLDIPESDINSIRSEHKDNVTEQALKMLRTWLQKAGNKATGNSLEKGLRKINREDIVNQCMINVELVTDDVEKAVAKVHLDQSGFDTFKEELGSSRDASLRRETSLNGTYDEQDIMKEAESAAETSSEGSDKETHYHLESKQTTVTAVELLEMGKETLEDEIADQIITMPSTEKMCFEVNHSLEEKEKVILEMNSKDLNNRQHTSECIIYEEEKSDLTSATVSSENTAEFEVLSSEDKPRTEVHTKKKEWTETDDSGSIRQVTQIKTETSITLSGEGTERIHDFKSENELPSINEQLSDAEEEMLSFVEKRNFFQRLSLTSEMLPLNSKWTQEVSLDDIPMAQGEIVKEQISFEDKLKMFEPDEDKRRKAQKRDKHEQPTVYRYDFTKPNKDKKSAAEHAVSELDKAEQIVKQVNNVLNEEECRLMIRNQDSKVENLLANRFESAFTLENIEHEVSSLLAEVDKEEKELSQKDIIVERGLKARKPSSLECKTGTSYSDYVDYNEGLDASCEIASYLDSTVKTPETLLSLSTQSEEMTCEDLRLSGIAHETESHHLKHCSGGEMESTTKDLEEIKSCSVSIPLEYVTPEQLSSVQELQERKSPLSHTMNMSSSSKESEHSITLFEQETPFSESQFKNVGQSDESGCEIDKYTQKKKFHDLGTLTFPPQHFDISEKFNSHIKTQILHEELDQSLEESPLEVKHIAEDIEHLLASSPCQTKDVMKQIRTEIFSQELGEDIESGSPEKKNIILDTLEKEAGEPKSEVIEIEDESYVSNNDSETHIIASQGEIISQRLQAVEDITITDSSMSRSFKIDTFSHQDVNVEFCESEINHQDFVPVKITQCPFDNDVLSSGNNLVERDDYYLKEYEEAKEEHSLSEQLLALASDVRRTSKCLDDDEIFSESCSSHMGFEHNLGSIHSQSETEKHRRLDTDVKYSRADKKEMRLLKSTKQVSTIEEHSSVESNDSSQELVQAEIFSPDIVPEVMILKETSEVCDVMLDSKEEFQVEKYGKGEGMCDQTVNESICFSNAVEDLPIVGNSILSREHVDINADKNSQETEFHKDPKEYFSSKDMFKDYKKNDSDAESVKSDDKKWDSDAEVVKIDDKRSDSDAECVRTDGELTPTQRKEESFSSSGETESPYYSVETSGYERTPHSTPAASRPCSSEFEVNILSGQGSEYETCATSQDVSGEVSGSYATAATSQETSYSTACSSLSHSSRESAYSVDSESSGHLGSIEVSSEASETLVPSAQEMELEFGQDIDVTVLDEDSVLIENAIKEPYDTYIPESVIRSGIELPFMKNWDMHKSSIEHHARQLSNHWNLHDAREDESLNCLSERREECKSNSSDAPTVLDKKYKCELGHQIDYQGMNLTTNTSSDDHQGESDSLQFEKSDILKETEGKDENVLFDIGNIHDHSENIDDDQCYSTTIGTNQEKNVSDHIDEDPPSMSESSATHSEQTWQTSSVDTAFHIPSSIPSSYFPLGGQNSVTLDSLPDKSNVKCTSEHTLPLSPKSKFINPASSYLQLNGPVEVDFNPEYDTFDDESAPQGLETVASYQMNDKNIDQSDFENASQTPADDTIGIKGSFACAQVYSEEQSKVDDDSFCSVISVEAEKPEAQQEQVLNYQDYEECFQPECVALSDDTTYLPESEQCSLRNILLDSSDLSQPENVPCEFSDEISSGLESHEALDFFKGAAAPNVGTVLQSGIQNVDSIEKSDILDTSPEDDRYDYKSHESKSQNVYEVHEAQKYEVILVSDEETAIELVGQSINQLQIGYQDHSGQESEITADKDLYLHQEGAMNMFQFGDSVQIPSSVPSGDEDKQSTPSFDTPAHRFFSKAGDHEGSSTSSLQEFENLETEMGAGRSSRTSSDSYDRAPVTRSGEHDDISMCSLNEFEKLEQDCVEAEQVDQIESEIVGMLSEIEEGHESQASDGQETISDDGRDQGSDNSDDYEKRMIEIDEIIRMAQNNVEKFHDEVLDDLSEGATLEFTVTQGIQASGGNSTEHSIVKHSACQNIFTEADSLTSVTNESFSMLKDETDTNSSSKHGAGKFTLPVSNVEEFTEQLFGVSHNVTEFLATESSKSLETDKSCILENQDLLSGLRTDEQHIEEEAMEILAFDSIKSGNDTNSILWAEKIRLYQGVEDSEILPDFLETDNGTGGGQDSSSSGEKNSCSGKGDCMVSSTDSIDPSSSTATHATYQFETDSVMSSSINSAQASGEECTMVSSTDTLEPEPKLSYSQGELIDEETTSSDGMISNVNCLKMSCFESESPSNISSATQIEKLECRDQSENSKYDVHEKVAGFLEKNDEMFENPEHISYDEGHSGFSNLESESDILHVCEMYKFEDNRDAIICEEVLSKESQKLITSLIPEKTDSLEEVKDCLEKLADELQENVKDSIPERLSENPSLIEKNILSNNDQPFPLDSYPHPISSASKSLHYPAPCDLSSLSSEMIQPQAPAFGFFQPDESVGDEDVVSKTTTTTRIVTTVTTEDGDELKEQVTEEGDDELRHSMEVILDQFMHEDVSDTQSFQPQ